MMHLSYSGDHSSINSLEEFAQTFGHFVSTSSAAERIVSSDEVWNKLLEVSDKTHHNVAVGGNAALMGTKFASLGLSAIVSGSIGGDLSKILKNNGVHNGEEVLGGSIKSDKPDQIHLILEYKAGDKFGDITATKSNRFIMHRDSSNSRLLGLETMEHAIPSLNPSAIVLSGLHLLEMWPSHNQESRLKDVVSKVLGREQMKTLLHVELASMTSTELLSNIVNGVFPYIDSIGLNEQELTFLYEGMGGVFKDSASIPAGDFVDCRAFLKSDITSNPPNIQAVANALSYILNTTKPGFRRLSRVHFHT
jgi:ADP-dependent glucokinase